MTLETCLYHILTHKKCCFCRKVMKPNVNRRLTFFLSLFLRVGHETYKELFVFIKIQFPQLTKVLQNDWHQNETFSAACMHAYIGRSWSSVCVCVWVCVCVCGCVCINQGCATLCKWWDHQKRSTGKENECWRRHIPAKLRVNGQLTSCLKWRSYFV